ncbi:hypothetical protein [Rhizobium sp. MHM7A]|uniref:hypothetical protein n=1 Tax=Rhizobium sp. MHM7A TaxID=2583233 RepID=UPI001105B5B9|nr:hypothetical protein [Rhizobium sp. MHM7A]TLX17185.1 hypothetical protein FFR93_07700 [Rhizobium sp. MHM7A]
MKEVLKVAISIGAVFAFFGWIGYALSGWLFWAVVLGLPTFILGGLQLAYQIDVRLLWLMDSNGQYDNEKSLLWAIAREIHRERTMGSKAE